MFKSLKVRGWVLGACVAMLAVAGGVAEASPRGGAKRSVDRVLAYDTDTYRVDLNGNERTVITLIGDGDTDLDIMVFDRWGNEVAADRDNTDVARVTFTPQVGGEYRIEIKNYGDVYNEYHLLIR